MIEQIVDKWLKDTKKDLFKNYIKLGLKASGDWGKSLETKSEVTNTSIKAKILANDYTVYLEDGRNKNKNQSEKALKAWVGWAGSTFLDDWVRDKRVNISPYAVAWKIAREGWKVPNKFNRGGLVSDIITPERIKELTDQIVQFKVQEVRSDVVKTFRK
jgi:hypothetical protein